MRRAALILNIHRTTVKRKVIYLAQKARLTQEELLKKFTSEKVCHLQFDDLITSEHTKLKPLSVSLAVHKKSRFILGAQVSTIPAFGHLAHLSRKKYGFRENEHALGVRKLLSKIAPFIRKDAIIESDEHKTYPRELRRFFPKMKHKRYKGGRGCVVGQGELKRLHFDPLFDINHTCAMMRANINRLIRRTWCTTKKKICLQDHLDIYIAFHNRVLIQN